MDLELREIQMRMLLRVRLCFILAMLSVKLLNLISEQKDFVSQIE